MRLLFWAMPLGAILRIYLKLRKGRVNNVLFVFHTVAAHKSDCFNEKNNKAISTPPS